MLGITSEERNNYSNAIPEVQHNFKKGTSPLGVDFYPLTSYSYIETNTATRWYHCLLAE